MGPHKTRWKFRDKTNKSAYANLIHKKNKIKTETKINSTRKNHVSENDLSKGGFPFHFAGPKKEETI